MCRAIQWLAGDLNNELVCERALFILVPACAALGLLLALHTDGEFALAWGYSLGGAGVGLGLTFLFRAIVGHAHARRDRGAELD